MDEQLALVRAELDGVTILLDGAWIAATCLTFNICADDYQPQLVNSGPHTAVNHERA